MTIVCRAQKKKGGRKKEIRYHVLYVVHLASRLLVVIVEARHRGHVILILALGASLVNGIFVCVFLNVFCSKKPPQQRVSISNLGDKSLQCLRAPLTFAS